MNLAEVLDTETKLLGSLFVNREWSVRLNDIFISDLERFGVIGLLSQLKLEGIIDERENYGQQCLVILVVIKSINNFFDNVKVD